MLSDFGVSREVFLKAPVPYLKNSVQWKQRWHMWTDWQRERQADRH